MNIRFLMNKVTGTWHLHQRSRLLHKSHMGQEEDTTTLAATDLSDKPKSALNILFQSGVPPSVISRVLEYLVQISSHKKVILHSAIFVFMSVFYVVLIQITFTFHCHSDAVLQVRCIVSVSYTILYHICNVLIPYLILPNC